MTAQPKHTRRQGPAETLILRALATGPLTVAQLSAKLTEGTAIYRALHILRDQSLIRVEREIPTGARGRRPKVWALAGEAA